MLNCFKYFQIYILEQMYQKLRQEKKIEPCQNDLIFTKIFELNQVFMYQND